MTALWALDIALVAWSLYWFANTFLFLYSELRYGGVLLLARYLGILLRARLVLSGQSRVRHIDREISVPGAP